MTNRPSIRSTSLMAGMPLLLVLLSGCAGNVHILHNDPSLLLPMPFVSVSSSNPPNRFELAAIVVNDTNNNYPANTFALRVDAYYSTTDQHSCHKTRDVEVYVPLVLGQLFELDHVRFDVPNSPPSPCHCYKDNCQGLMWVTLIRLDNHQQVEGDLTKFGITWVSSGDLNEADVWEMIN